MQVWQLLVSEFIVHIISYKPVDPRRLDWNVVILDNPEELAEKSYDLFKKSRTWNKIIVNDELASY